MLRSIQACCEKSQLSQSVVRSDPDILGGLGVALGETTRSLTGNLGNIALLKIAADLDLISVQSAEQCRTAYREFRRMQHALRLNGAQYARISLEQVKQHAQAVRELRAAVFGSS